MTDSVTNVANRTDASVRSILSVRAAIYVPARAVPSSGGCTPIICPILTLVNEEYRSDLMPP
jgi:hypothetical protein